MFELISNKMQDRMSYLESLDKRDRIDGTTRMQRLRQIPPETGRFIALLAGNAPDGEIIEIGASAGYSTLYLSLAARERGIRMKTYEILPAKIKLARQTFSEAAVEDFIELVEGDALDHLKELDKIAFCFLDAEKEIYEDCWDIISEKIVPGGVLIADNAINHRATLQPMIDKSLSDTRFDSMIVPIGKGELVCRRKI